MNTPHGAQTLHVGSRSLPVVGLPHLRDPRSATALLEAGVPPVRSAPGQRQRQAYRSKLPHKGAPRVEEDQAGLAGPELHDRQGRIDPVALEARDCTHDRPTASRGVAPGSPRSDRTRAGCFRWRRDDVPWQSRKPTSERTTQTRKIPSGASGGRCAGSSSRASNWTTPIRRARNASGPPTKELKSRDKGPLTRPGSPVIAPLNPGQLGR